MFKVIAQWGVHLVPTLFDERVSVIHAKDLAAALLTTANHGRRVLTSSDSSQGIYFAAADEAPTYADLGRMIGQSFGRKRVLVLATDSFRFKAFRPSRDLVPQIRKPTPMYRPFINKSEHCGLCPGIANPPSKSFYLAASIAARSC